MARHTAPFDDRLILPSLQVPEPSGLRQRVAELERLFGAAQEEIALLTSERDELVSSVKKWAKADRIERQDLLFEATTQELRTELKLLRAENRRLKRENQALHTSTQEEPRRLRA